jgi:hypothetical protein
MNNTNKEWMNEQIFISIAVTDMIGMGWRGKTHENVGQW